MKTLLLIGVAALVAGPSPNPPSRAREVEVVALDYAFRMPAELPAGLTTFRFRNDGKVFHELAIVRLKDGATIDQFIQLAKESKPVQSLIDGAVGVLFAAPGTRSTSGLTTYLTPGRHYAVHCELRDSATAPQHFEMGMYSVISVRPLKAAPANGNTEADTIVATEYAFRYPRTLSPGHHTLVFRNDGRVRHELNIALLKKGVTLEQFLKVRKAKANARALTDEGLGVLFSQGGEEPLGRLEVNLLPGREYRIICIFMDDPKAPPHFELGMYGSIRVTGKSGS